jgi:oxygen-independent coproporphyrinogen-3 oxidase
VSNHARPGHECRHNLVYWRGEDYAGAGPGAHARLTTAAGPRAVVTEKHPETWRDRVMREGHALVEDAPLDPADRAVERLLMGLRLDEGVTLDPILRARIDAAALDGLTADGLMARNGETIRATRDGRRVLDAVLRALVR